MFRAKLCEILWYLASAHVNLKLKEVRYIMCCGGKCGVPHHKPLLILIISLHIFAANHQYNSSNPAQSLKLVVTILLYVAVS